ncbi:MAG: hypothetical protein QMD46_12365 [Methanomicrobiales archaeon]|nr:hypothetical protein [Methanomicrobiales archaeon]
MSASDQRWIYRGPWRRVTACRHRDVPFENPKVPALMAPCTNGDCPGRIDDDCPFIGFRNVRPRSRFADLFEDRNQEGLP